MLTFLMISYTKGYIVEKTPEWSILIIRHNMYSRETADKQQSPIKGKMEGVYKVSLSRPPSYIIFPFASEKPFLVLFS